MVEVLDQMSWIGKALSDYELGEHDVPYYLEQLSNYFCRRRYDKGEKVVKTGDKMKSMNIVLSGVAMEEGTKYRITHGHVIGGRGLLACTGRLHNDDKAIYKHDIVAKTPLYTVEVSAQHFSQWFEQESEVGDIILEALEQEENNKQDPRLLTVLQNKNLSAILRRQGQDCVVS